PARHRATAILAQDEVVTPVPRSGWGNSGRREHGDGRLKRGVIGPIGRVVILPVVHRQLCTGEALLSLDQVDIDVHLGCDYIMRVPPLAAAPTGAWWRPALRRPRVVAHRGGRGLAPENTLVACAQALALGVDAVEVDVRLTADGVPV